MKVANRHIAQGGKIAIEWPRNCSYWKRPEVHNWIKSKELNFAHFHGCAVGLVHPNGKPMQKAWKVASNDEHLVRALDVLRCPHGKAKGIHEHVGGSVTKRTELYTDQLVNTIHQAWAKSCKSNVTKMAVTAASSVMAGGYSEETDFEHPKLVAGQVLSTQPCRPCLGAFNTPLVESPCDVNLPGLAPGQHNDSCKQSHRDNLKKNFILQRAHAESLDQS